MIQSVCVVAAAFHEVLFLGLVHNTCLQNSEKNKAKQTTNNEHLTDLSFAIY